MKLLILGSGYTGPVLKNFILDCHQEAEVLESSRGNHKDIQFDFNEFNTWKNLPKADCAFVLFPLDKTKNLSRWIDFCLNRFTSVIICSSSGFFQTEFEDQRITELHPIDLSNNRAYAEEACRKSGQIVVHAAGIYGPGRNPITWLVQGRVSPSPKFVNLVHVEDLAQYLWNAYRFGEKAKRYIASDGTPKRWNELSQYWEATLDIEFDTQVTKPTCRPSKQLDNSWTRERLKVSLKHPNSAEAAAKLWMCPS